MEERGELENISIILVEPLQGGNVGSVARVMKNMGLRRLKMVRPRATQNPECERMAGKALEIVQEARCLDSFEDAVAEEQVLVGTTSSRQRTSRRPHILTPREAAPRIRRLAQKQRVALIFGSERGGLDNSLLARCHTLVSIPASPDYPVLNLSHAVMVMAYELYSCARAETSPPELADQNTMEQMYSQIQDVLVRIGFLSADHPEPILDSIRRFLGRAQLTDRDVRILRGIFSQVAWFYERGHQLPAEKIRKP